jgi:hypothetical protein
MCQFALKLIACLLQHNATEINCFQFHFAQKVFALFAMYGTLNVRSPSLAAVK